MLEQAQNHDVWGSGSISEHRERGASTHWLKDE